MPKIPEYVSEVAPQGQPPARNATGADFGNDGLETLGKAVQGTSAVQYEKASQDDVTNVRVAMAKARAEWDVNFRDRAAASTPGDPGFAPKFTQDFADYIGKARDIAQTRDGQRTFDLLSSELAGHFAEKAGIFAVQSAGVKAKNDWNVSQRAYATSIVTDPTSYGSVLAQAMSELRDPKGQYGRLDNNTRQDLETKARDTMAQAYVNGLIDNGAPELARKILMDGRLDDQLDPKDKQRLVHASDAGITAKRVASEHAEAQAAREQKKLINGINDGLMGKFVDGKLTMGDVRAAGLPTFGEGSQDTWVTRLRTQAKEWRAEQQSRTDPAVFNALRERIDLPFGDPRKVIDREDIWKAFGKGLSEADAGRLERRFVDARSDSGQKWSQAESEFIRNVVKPQLDKSTLVRIDQGGGERVQDFTTYLRTKADEMRKGNSGDPYTLLQKDSPNYIGKDIPRFQTGAQRTAVDLTKRINDSMDKSGKPRKSLDEIFKGSKP